MAEFTPTATLPAYWSSIPMTHKMIKGESYL
jgi:hypothetical protein